jgi:hypothetical protein
MSHRHAGPGQRAQAGLEGPVALRGLKELRQRDQHEADRDVEPEDPLPGDPLAHGAADERAERDAEAAHAGPDIERHPAFLAGHGLGEQRQRQRQDDGGPETLQRARPAARRTSACRR